MNAVVEIERQSTTDLVVDKVLTPAVVFAPGGVESILAKITAEVRAFKADISTPTGRKAVASIAHKVARSKTALDDMGKELVADWKAKSSAVDAERRTIREQLDALKDEVRKPLTDWEDAEKDRTETHETALHHISAHAVFAYEPSAADVDQRLSTLKTLAERDWQEFTSRATEATAATVAKLTEFRSAAVQREAERAELERLRKEAAERTQRERDERIAAEAAERATREAEAKAARDAADAARKAAQERQRIEQEKAAAIARAEKAEADKKAAAAKAERDKREAIEAERKRVAEAEAAERSAAAKREADRKYTAKINKAAADALVVVAGLEPRKAMAVVAAIAQGDIPHVSIAY